MTKRLPPPSLWSPASVLGAKRESGNGLSLWRCGIITTRRISASTRKQFPEWSAQTTLRSPTGKQCICFSLRLEVVARKLKLGLGSQILSIFRAAACVVLVLKKCWRVMSMQRSDLAPGMRFSTIRFRNRRDRPILDSIVNFKSETKQTRKNLKDGFAEVVWSGSLGQNSLPLSSSPWAFSFTLVFLFADDPSNYDGIVEFYIPIIVFFERHVPIIIIVDQFANYKNKLQIRQLCCSKLLAGCLLLVCFAACLPACCSLLQCAGAPVAGRGCRHAPHWPLALVELAS
jgi:hypothetical protein